MANTTFEGPVISRNGFVGGFVGDFFAPITAAEKSAILARVNATTRAQTPSIRQAEVAARKAQLAKVQKLRTRIVTVAKKQVGDRYSAGASGPSAFDCSGLTRYVYKVATGKELPHHSRAQYAKVKRIKRSQAKPGDLVFSELMINPEVVDDENGEWVELYNTAGYPIDVAGYSFHDLDYDAYSEPAT